MVDGGFQQTQNHIDTLRCPVASCMIALKLIAVAVWKQCPELRMGCIVSVLGFFLQRSGDGR